MIRPRLVLALALALGCGRGGPRAAGELEAALTALYDADQAERSGPIESVNMEELDRRDSLRRDSLKVLVALGALKSAASYYHAAMVLQHGRDSVAYFQANAWARKAELLDSTRQDARWLVAATWDRYQMSRGQPQWYGTQTNRLAGGKGAVVLYDLDRTRISDAERTWRGVGTLASLCARLDTINDRLHLTSPGCFALP